MDDSREEWKPVVGFEGLYEVSSLGRIRRTHTQYGTPVCRIRKLHLQRTGYYTVTLSKANVIRAYSIHELVARAFLGERPPGMEINHIDFCRTNNAADNLEYMSRRDNILHTCRALRHNYGSKHYRTTLTEERVRDIKIALRGVKTIHGLPRQFGVSRHVLKGIAKGGSWRHVTVDD